jgi:hypothetical protein
MRWMKARNHDPSALQSVVCTEASIVGSGGALESAGADIATITSSKGKGLDSTAISITRSTDGLRTTWTSTMILEPL